MRLLTCGWPALLAILLFAPAQAEFEHFITVDGTNLMDGDEPFHFVAFKVPTLFYVEDEMAFGQSNPCGLPTEFDIVSVEVDYR